MVKKHLHILLIACSIFFSEKILAQDVHFSMFDMSPLTLNPANTGNIISDRRLCNIYRTQWKAIGKPLQTFAASYDQKIYFLPGNFSAGVTFISDKSGGIDLVENKILFSAAVKLIAGMNSFSIGLQAGYVSKVLSLNGMTFPEQYSRDIGQFDVNLFSGESNYSLKKGYLDVNGGIIHTLMTERGNIQSGIAIFHINNPDDSFYNNGLGLKMRYSFHTKYQHRFNEKWFMRPSVSLMTMEKAQELVINGVAGIFMPTNTLNIRKAWFGMALRTGVSRNGDSAIPTAGLEFKFFDIAAAYDVIFSDLKLATNNRGAFEVALIYNSRSTSVNRILIPCDRF